MSEDRSSTQPAGPGVFSAADMKRRMAEREAAKAAEEMRHVKEQEEKLAKHISNFPITRSQ